MAHLATGHMPKTHTHQPTKDDGALWEFLPYSRRDLAEVGLGLAPEVVAMLMRCFSFQKDDRPTTAALAKFFSEQKAKS